MLVFWEQRLVILATPKTGSTAIEAALESLAILAIQRPPQLKHTSVQRYRKFIAPYLRQAAGTEFTVVALMREPRDWLGSWFRYRQRKELADPERSTRNMTFEEFSQSYCADPQPGFAKVGSQAQFLIPRNGPAADRLFRYEDMGVFVNFLEDRLNCVITLPRLNVSPRSELDLSADTQALLDRKQSADLKLYASI